MEYRETVRAPWWFYAVLALLSALLCFTFAAAATVPVAVVLWVVIVAVGSLVIAKRVLRISVDPENLHVGKLVMPRSQIVSASPLDADQLRDVAGPDADARALLILRDASTPEGVKVDLVSTDVPYWLVSSRHPEQLAEALNSPTPSA